MENIKTFLESALGNFLLIVIFFVAVIAFLRFCFGPGGRLREKKWDKLNEPTSGAIAEMPEQIKKRLELLEEYIKPEKEIFASYAHSFLRDEPEHDSMHQIKLEHSLRVLGNALQIASTEKDFINDTDDYQLTSSKKFKLNKILILSALYHDLGRFEQLERYKTFIDSESLNHATLSAKLLQSSDFLKNISPKEKKLISTAIAVHNKMTVPKIIPQFIRPVCNALRDADKLDIINIMHTELALGNEANRSLVLFRPDIPDKFTEKIALTVLKQEPASYQDMQYVNDFRLIICGWVYTLNYETSIKILANSGHVEAIMSGLPSNELIDRVKDSVKKYLDTFR